MSIPISYAFERGMITVLELHKGGYPADENPRGYYKP